MNDEQRRAILDAVEAYEEAWRRQGEALRRMLAEGETAVDTHPAALDYRMARWAASAASDGLIRVMMDAVVNTLRVRGRGRDVVYLITRDDGLAADEAPQSCLVIRRIDLDEHGSDPLTVLHTDAD